MQTLMIAGNHDSGYRIEQVEPLLEKYNAKTVGVVRWNEDKTLDLDRLLLPIYNQNQDCGMVPCPTFFTFGRNYGL